MNGPIRVSLLSLAKEFNVGQSLCKENYKCSLQFSNSSFCSCVAQQQHGKQFGFMFGTIERAGQDYG